MTALACASHLLVDLPLFGGPVLFVVGAVLMIRRSERRRFAAERHERRHAGRCVELDAPRVSSPRVRQAAAAGSPCGPPASSRRLGTAVGPLVVDAVRQPGAGAAQRADGQVDVGDCGLEAAHAGSSTPAIRSSSCDDVLAQALDLVLQPHDGGVHAAHLGGHRLGEAADPPQLADDLGQQAQQLVEPADRVAEHAAERAAPGRPVGRRAPFSCPRVRHGAASLPRTLDADARP